MKTPLLLSILAALTLVSCKSNEMSDEDRLDIYSESAFVHYEQGDLARAESQALKGLKIDIAHVPLNLMMGWIMLRQDRRDTLLRAEQIFRRMVEDEEDHRVYLGLATTLERLGSLHAEAAVAVAAGKRATEFPDREVRAGELEQDAQRMWRESRELYNKTLATRSKNIKALNGSMRVTAVLGESDASLEYCDTLLKTLAGERAFWANLLQRENLSLDEEADLRKQVRDARQLMVDANLFAANLEHDLGRDQAAVTRLDRVLELDPELPEGYSLRAQLLAETGRLEDAVADLDRYIARSDKPYEHPDIKRAFELLTTWNRSLRRDQ